MNLDKVDDNSAWWFIQAFYVSTSFSGWPAGFSKFTKMIIDLWPEAMSLGIHPKLGQGWFPSSLLAMFRNRDKEETHPIMMKLLSCHKISVDPAGDWDISSG